MDPNSLLRPLGRVLRQLAEEKALEDKAIKDQVSSLEEKVKSLEKEVAALKTKQEPGWGSDGK